ncbi:LPS translocon maturation chaperone LptM [Candidatus Vallotia cooleyia]|uniref:LPS translocon maturation chaperone LptM n=1 Tax=Candidatus Vallotiella adelgis TaxID=1177211 RepID=UPI001D008C11|nr:lipoprotein [Candidatus Vallotia cooleyia]UDG82272.1 hypothetical protein GJV44_00529 [Candidatus Vallotia cooleyia]
MQVTSGLSKIIAGPRVCIVVVSCSIIASGIAVLAGCGQRGPLYLPNVPPLPKQPAFITQAERAIDISSAHGVVDASPTPFISPLQHNLRTASSLSVPRSTHN